MATQTGGKGNPAAKRMSNPKLKERRARSWARGKRRKAARVAAQEERRAANLAWLAERGLLPGVDSNGRRLRPSVAVRRWERHPSKEGMRA